MEAGAIIEVRARARPVGFRSSMGGKIIRAWWLTTRAGEREKAQMTLGGYRWDGEQISQRGASSQHTPQRPAFPHVVKGRLRC